MPGSVIQLSMGFGYPGSYSRMPDDIVAQKPAKTAIPFGSPVILNSDNTFSVGGATLTAANFAGIAVREVKQAITIVNDQGGYAVKEPTDVLMRGNTVIKLTRGTPVAGGTVYFRTTVDAQVDGSAVGDIETAAGNGLVALSNVVFTTGKVDSNGIVEVTIKTRNNN